MTNLKLLESTARYRKTKRGVVTNIYQHLKARHYVEFDLAYLHTYSDCKKFDRLYVEWVKSNYDKQFKPTIDRINNKLPYLKTNIHWLTWAENRYKQRLDRRNNSREVLQIMGGKVINTYKSQREAVLKTGLSQGNMSYVLNGKRKYCGGYIWRYKNEQIEVIGTIHDTKLAT